MDNSYPVTPYPLSPYGANEQQQQQSMAHEVVNSQQQQARQLMAYLIAPPQATAPPSQAATIAGEPTAIMVQHYANNNNNNTTNQQSQQTQHGEDCQVPMNYSPSTAAFTTQPIISPVQAGKPQQPPVPNYSSYEPLPSLPNMVPIVSMAASPQPASMMRPQQSHNTGNAANGRMRAATDMSIFPQSTYYHPSHFHMVRMGGDVDYQQQQQSQPQPQYQPEDLLATPIKPTKPQQQQENRSKSHLQSKHHSRALKTHSIITRIMMPYWMLVCVALLLSAVVLLGRVAQAVGEMKIMEPHVTVEPRIVMPAGNQVQAAQPAQPQPPVVRSRPPILHSAPINPALAHPQ